MRKLSNLKALMICVMMKKNEKGKCVMKFFHISDVHLGVSPDPGFPWSDLRCREIWQSFEAFIQKVSEKQVDLLLIAGDLFHRQPLMREIKEINSLFALIPKTKIVLIAGEHDYLRPDSCYLKFQWSPNVFVMNTKECRGIYFPDLNTEVYGLSYYEKEISEPLYDGISPQNNGYFHILLAHGGDEKHIPIDRRKMAQSGFHYVAMGHCHKFQPVIDYHAYYSGALEPIEKTDLGPHGYIEGDVDEYGRMRIRFIPWAKREYLILSVTSNERFTDQNLKDQVAEGIKKRGKQHFYRILIDGVRDPMVHFDLEGCKKFGNVVEIMDRTTPIYNFRKLLLQNGDNLIGRYIRHFQNGALTEAEKEALYEGIDALLDTKR